jgi:hypothetical protein
MLRLASDADVHGEIVRGLCRRLLELDLVRVQDALPEGTPDPEVLAWAAAENGYSLPTIGTRWWVSPTSG